MVQTKILVPAQKQLCIIIVKTMQTFSTPQLLDSLENETLSFLNDAISRWQVMPDSRFSLQPAHGGWSAKQCLAHLNSYGDFYLPAIEKAIARARQQKSSPHPIYKPGWLGNYFTKMMEPGVNGQPVKKMKAFKKYIHGNGEAGYKVVAAFIDQQEKMLALIIAAGCINISNTRTGISIAPAITLQLGDVFRFIAAHNKRHLLQAARAAGME